MQKIAECKYDEFDIVFVMAYYDRPLSGLCEYEGKLCYFDHIHTEYPPSGMTEDEQDDWYEENEDRDTYLIYRLSFLEKLKYLKTKKLFELCVGYHQSYKDNKKVQFFYIRKPKWLYSFLYNVYFKRWNKLFTKYPK